MESKTVDIREELQRRISEVQEKLDKLLAQRDMIDELAQATVVRLRALRVVYENEVERLGVREVPLFVGKGAPSRFTGMKLINALALLRKEKPGIGKKEACKILEKEGFNFRTNRHLSAVHFAWITLERMKKGGR